MNKEAFEAAWNTAIKGRGPRHWSKQDLAAAIEAYLAALAKIGLGIRPRMATKEMAIAGAKAMQPWKHAHGTVIVGQPKDVWQAMWDRYQEKSND